MDLHQLKTPDPDVTAAHKAAEAALLAAAVAHGRAQADLKERGGVLAVRERAAHDHMALNKAAVAYASAHAALVAAS